jgi:filamentous hemagglutinin family protein
MLLASVAAAALLSPLALPRHAEAQQPGATTLPTGGRVVAGGATIATPSPDHLRITQTTQRAAIDWQSFSVGERGHVQFQQPNANAIALNRVTGPDASVIAGRISANGQVAIVNQSGIVFTPTARVDAGALVASAAGISNEAFMAGRMVFDAPPRPGAKVVNEGRITVAETGLAALVGPQAANRGTIEARLGRVVIAGAESVTLDLAGDGLIALEVTRPTRVTQAPAAANTGTIAAEGGTVLITAEAAGQLVSALVEAGGTVAAREGGRVAVAARGGEAHVSGTVDVSALQGRGGDVTVTGRQVSVAQGARIDASGAAGGGTVRVGGDVKGQGSLPRAARSTVAQGAEIRADATVAGDGGLVVVWADEAAFVHGRLSARGGPGGGAGGFIETSALGALSLAGIAVDAGAPAGRQGTWLIDPYDLTIGTTTNNGTFLNGVWIPNPGVAAATLDAAALSTALTNTDVVLSTAGPGSGSGRITIAAPVSWTNDPEFGPAQTALTLNAVGDIVINAPVSSATGRLVLNAGPTNTIVQGPSGTIVMRELSATAGRTITLGNPANSFTTVTAASSATGSLTLASLLPVTFTAPVTAGQDITLAAPSLATGPVTAGPGRTITLTADALALGGPVSAPGGTIAIAPLTAGLGVTLGATPGETLGLGPEVLGQIVTDGGTVRIGSARTGPMTIGGGAPVVFGATQAATLELRSGGTIAQTQPLSVARLAVAGATVALGSAENAIGSLAASSASAGGFAFATTATAATYSFDEAITAPGPISLRVANAGLVLAAPLVAPGGLSLTAGGSITQATGATITAPSLTAAVTGPGAAIALGNAANRIGALAGATVGGGGGNITVATAEGLAVTGAVAGPGAVSLAAQGPLSVASAIAAGGAVLLSSRGALGLAGAVSSETAVSLSAVTGISQTASGPITAPTLTAATTIGTIGLEAANAVGRLSGVTIGPGSGTFAFATTTALVVDGAVTVPGDVRLAAGGALTQTARIAAEALTVSGTSIELTNPGNDFASLAGATATGTGARPITITTPGTLVVSGPVSGGTVTLTTGGTLSLLPTAPVTATGPARLSGAVGLAASASISGDGGVELSSTGGVSTGAVTASGGDVTVAGQSVFAGGAVTAGPGRRIALAADAISAAEALRAPGGVVAFAPRSPGGSISLGSTSGPGLVLSPATLSRVEAGTGTLAVGDASSGALTIRGVFDVRGRAATLALTGTSIGQVAPFAADGLAVTSGAGGIGLGNGGNLIARLARIETPSAPVTVATAGALAITGPVTAGTFTVNAGGAVTQTAEGAVTAARLAGRAERFALGGAENRVAALGALTATDGDIAVATTGPVGLLGAISTPGTFRLDAGGTVGAAPGVRLTAARLEGRASGGTVLDDAPHAVGTLGAWTDATGGLSLTVGGPLAVAGPVLVGGPLALAAGGAMAIDGSVGAGGGLSLSAGGTISQGPGSRITTPMLAGGSIGGADLTSTTNAIAALGPWSDGSGGLSVVTGTALAVTGAVTVGGALDLAASRITQAPDAPIDAALVSARAADGIGLGAAGNRIGRFGTLTAEAGDITLASTLARRLDGPVRAGGTLSLQGGGTITQTAPIEAARLEATAQGGLVLDTPGNAIRTTGEVTNTGGGPLALATATALLIDGRLATPGTIRLETGGALAQSATGSVEAGTLTGRSTGGAILDGDANAVATLAGWTNEGAGGFRLVTAGGLSVTGPVNAGAGALVLDARAGGSVTLAADLTTTAASGIEVAAAGRIVAGRDTHTAPAIAFRSFGTGQEMRITGGTYIASDRVVFAATGDISFSGTTRIEPLSGGLRPTIVISSRTAAEPADATRVRPDIPGLPDQAQFTQIEGFVPPTGTARNRIALGSNSLVAPGSALFLVIDGGAATGTIDVARLGLITRGGRTELSGCVNGVCGPSAASLGRTTDPSSEARLNNCPVSSPNCLTFPVTASVVATQPRDFPAVVTERSAAALEIPLADVSDEEE